MLTYLGHIIGLFGALLGLVGNTWDKEASGRKKLTLTGRLSLSVILAGFVLSSWSMWQQHQENKRLQAVAAKEINESVRALMYPLTTLLWSVDGKSFEYSADTLAYLGKRDTFAKISRVDILGDAPHYQGMWLEVLSNSSKRGREGLDLAQGKFNAFLDREIIVAIQNVIACHELTTLTVANDAFGRLREQGRKMPFGDLTDPKFYFEYVQALTELHAAVEAHLPQPPAEPTKSP